MLIFSLVLFFSCSNKDALIIADEAWAALRGSEKSIEKEFRGNGFRVDVAVAGIKSTEADLYNIIETSDRDIIMLSPLFSGFAGRLSENYPRRRFIAYGSWDQENLVSIVSDRTEAMKEVGLRSAEWVAGRCGNDATVSAVFLAGSEVREREYQAFMEGWEQAQSGCRLEVERMRDGDTEDSLDEFLSLDLLEKTLLGVFFAGKFNQRAVEYCVSVSIPVITEHVPEDAEYSSDFVYFLKESYVDGLIRALSALKSREDPQRMMTLEVDLIEGGAKRPNMEKNQ